MPGGLKIQLAFFGGADDSVPVCLVQDTYATASAPHILATCYFGDIDQDWGGGGNVIGSDVVWRRLSREGV